MAINKRLLVKPPSTGITPSEHFGVALYEGDGSSSHSINGGKFGAGAYFKGGTSNNIDLDINLTTKKTISMWVKNNSFPAYNVHLIRPSTDNLNFGFLQSTRTVFLWDGNSTQNWGYAIPNDTNFHHLVLAIDGTNAKLYVDNDDKGSITIVANSQTQLRLGRNSGTSGLDGVMDQVRIFQKQLSSSEVSTLYAETAATVESLDPLSEDTTDTLQVLGDSSCIATYRFENDETDLSGNYDGTGTEIQYAAGRYGQAASFNGSASKVDIANLGIGGAATRTISAWVNTNSLSSAQTIFQYGASANGQRFGFAIDAAGKVYVEYYNRDAITSSAHISVNTWYHLAVTYNGGAIETATNTQIYVNGSAVSMTTSGAQTGNANTANSNYGIGYRRASSTQYFNGEIDQVRIFNKELSASEVTTLYQENSLVASYRFEGNANDDMRTYNGTATNVTYEYGLNFTPDFVWLKERSAAESHRLFDTTRGATKRLFSDNTNAESTATDSLTSFDTGGFTVGSSAGVNQDGQDYVAWCLKANGGTTSSNTDGDITSTVQANQTAGFSIVTYTGNGTQPSSIGHGLSSAPTIVMNKCLSLAGTNWHVYTSSTGATSSLVLNDTAAAYTGVGEWNTAPDSTRIYVGNTNTNASGRSYISYCFHDVENFSKFGSYTGNGSTTGPIVETGFEPAFLMVKRTDAASSNWFIYDNKRDTVNPNGNYLIANESYAENNLDSYSFYFLSNGFQVNSTDVQLNASGGTYLYMAFAADPDTEAPTVAKSFSTVAYTGNGSTQSIDGLGFSPSLVWLKQRDAVRGQNWFDSIRGVYNLLQSNNTNANTVDSTQLTSFDSDGFTVGSASGVNANGGDFVAWAWKADDNEPTINTEGSIESLVSANANAGFSIVQYSISSPSSTDTIGHGLSAAPEFIMTKTTSAATDWYCWHTALGTSNYIRLTTSAAQSSSNLFNSVTSSNFQYRPSANPQSYIAYCFHSVSGYSKFGSYSGSGYTTNTITTGFQPDFVMIKAYTNSTAYTSWVIFDSVRYGSSSDTNPIYANLSAAEGTRGNGSGDGDVLEISFTSTGFQLVNNAADETNDANKDYIYIAFKIN